MLYAAYGSNLHPLRLRQRTPTAQLLGTAAISDMQLKFHKRGYRDFSGKCNIVENGGHQVYVAIYDITPAEMTLLDSYEGAGSGYNRMSISVENFGRCAIYTAASAHTDERLRPFDWYKALVIAGCEWLEFPAHYVEGIRSIEATVDENSDRRAHHMRLVHQTNP